MFVQKYSLGLRILHWLIAAIVLFMIALGWYMTDLPREDPVRGTLYMLHKSVGVVVLVLAIVRLVVRVSRPVPSLPLTVPRRQRQLAEAGYAAVYVLLFAIPITGYLLTSAFGMKVSWFNLVDLPTFFSAPNRALGEVIEEIHVFLAYTLLAWAALHVAAVIKHYVLDKVNLLPRMW